MTLHEQFDFTQSPSQLMSRLEKTSQLVKRAVKISTSNGKVSLSIEPRVFAIMNDLPIFPTIISNDKFNKAPNARLAKSIFGTNSYKEVRQMYLDHEVTVEQYQRVLSSPSFALLTSSGDSENNSNSFVCLDADSHKDRVNGAMTNVDDNLINAFKTKLFDASNTIITSPSQSGNQHIYGYSEALNHQSTKGVLFKNNTQTFELDIKTSNNYVVIYGKGYGNFTIEADLNDFLAHAKQVILASFKRRGVNFFLDLYGHDFTHLSDIAQVRFILAVSAMMHVNVLSPQNFDTSVGTSLIKKQALKTQANAKTIQANTVKTNISKNRQKQINRAQKAKFKQKRKDKKTQDSSDQTTLTKSFIVTSKKHNKGKNKVVQIPIGNEPILLNDAKNALAKYDTADKVTKFEHDIATAKLDKLDKFTDNYSAGNRGSSILNVAEYLYMNNWSEDDALDKLSAMDANSTDSLIRDGLRSEVELSVSQGFKGIYRPDRFVLEDTLGVNPYTNENPTSKDQSTKYRAQKAYQELTARHNSSTVNLVLNALMQKVLHNASAFTPGDSANTTYAQLAKHINTFLIGYQTQQSVSGLKKLFREFFLIVQDFNDWDLYAWFIYKATNNRQSQAEINTDAFKQIQAISNDIKRVYSKQVVMKHAINFKRVMKVNKNLLARLSSEQIINVLQLALNTKRGRKGGISVNVRDSTLMPINTTFVAMRQSFVHQSNLRKELLTKANSNTPMRVASFKAINVNSNSSKQLPYQVRQSKRTLKKAHTQMSSICSAHKYRLVVENEFKLLIQAMVRLDSVKTADNQLQLNNANRVSNKRSDLTRKGLIKALVLHGP